MFFILNILKKLVVICKLKASRPNAIILVYSVISLTLGNSVYANLKQDLSHHPQWHALLHYEKQFPFGHISRNDGPAFFLSAQGKFRPDLELNENIKEFNENPNYYCQFPARYYFLKNFIKPRSIKAQCPNLKAWLNHISSKEIQLNFAGQFPYNPASLFGHTFLTFVSTKSNHYLLNTSVGYAAKIDPNDYFLSYIVKGLTGQYQGTFTFDKTHIFLSNYSNIEKRDLWTYTLNLNSKQIKLLLFHLWELKNKSQFNYLFLSENCSYMIMSILNTVFYKKKLLNFLPIYTLPSETIKILYSKNLIKKMKFKESLQTQFDNHLKSLQKKENFLQSNSPMALKTRALYYRLKNDTHSLDQVLKKSSKIKHILKTIKKTKDSPHKSHSPFKIALGRGHNESSFYQFSVRPNFHSLKESDIGIHPELEMETLQFKIRYYPDLKDIHLESLDLINLIAINPWNKFNQPISWKLSNGIQTQKNNICFDCHQFYLNGAVGVSKKYQRSYVFSFLNLNNLYGTKNSSYFTFSIAPEFGLVLKEFSNLNIISSVQYEYKTITKSKNKSQFMYSFSTNYHLSQKFFLEFDAKYLSITNQKNFQEIIFNFHHYY